MAPRACSSAARTDGSFSSASCRSTAGSVSGSGWANTDWAAARRFAAIGAAQRQRADGGVERAAQAVVHPDRLRPGWRRSGAPVAASRSVPSRSLTSRWWSGRASRRPSERAREHRLGARVAARREVADALLDVVEAGCARAGRAPRRRSARRRAPPAPRRTGGRSGPIFALSAQLPFWRREWSGRGGRLARHLSGRSRSARRQLPVWPPHLPVLTLKFPQRSGARQSEIRSFEPSR